MRPIHTIIHHCTATPEGREVSVETIRGWHTKMGWSDIGYHFVVQLDGTISNGRPLDKVGSHVAGHNTGSIGISYVGGVAKDGKTGKDTRTGAQKEALHKLTADLVKRFPSITKIAGHRDFSPDKDGDGKITQREWLKECPCYSAEPEYAYLLKRAA
ncbi:N-acetylmuramoyl-L-alanine amidase [Sinorhizobium meliloti]|uniref:N-acetylmuramoyl-L-alanine amidase n=1 Tax=Rhizobium meliloti TaxID=382 RepID=UPI000FD7ACD7|nr:N-acetylmuramoyl-L-alanine amidase [Sinorhizobium meliloti]RVL87686.1 N-acetylmuramoyl-L-alanine amidase [Sinorhizobium meliloti]